MNNLKGRFGRRLRAIRRQREMTQERLAEIVGVSTEFISLIERGVHAPSFDNIERLAEALQVDPADFFSTSG